MRISFSRNISQTTISLEKRGESLLPDKDLYRIPGNERFDKFFTEHEPLFREQHSCRSDASRNGAWRPRWKSSLCTQVPTIPHGFALSRKVQHANAHRVAQPFIIPRSLFLSLGNNLPTSFREIFHPFNIITRIKRDSTGAGFFFFLHSTYCSRHLASCDYAMLRFNFFPTGNF